MRATIAGDVRRQAIVVLSDGEDTSSLVPFEEVLDLAKRSEITSTRSASAAATSARAGSPKPSSCSSSSPRRPAAARSSRPAPPSWRASTRRSPTSWRAQYPLAYSSRNPRRDGQWRRIVVRTTRPELAARTKQGYFGPVN